MVPPRKLLFLCILPLLLGASALQADYYYYGVGNNEFWHGSLDLWDALEPLPEWSDPGDEHCINSINRKAWDGGSGDSMMGDLTWYANNLQAGDVFLFSYVGHGGWNLDDDDNDEGDTSRPQAEDPTPGSDPPYDYDEYFGYVTDPFDINNQMSDDDFWVFDNFNEDVEVITISAACHSGGWVGGTNDLDQSTPANNNGLYAMLAAPEHAYSVGYYAGWNPAYGDYYKPLLHEALAVTARGNITFPEWFDAAMTYGETHQHLTDVSWQEEDIYLDFWPSADWEASTHENTWYDDHWGWEEHYAQLRPTSYSSLDIDHDHLIGTPEPATAMLVVIGLVALAVRQRFSET